MMTADDFCKKHNITERALYMRVHQKSLPEGAYDRDSGALYINEKFLAKRFEFKKKITNKAHDNYYFLIMLFKESDICRMLHKIDSSRSITSWSTFLSADLFARGGDSILQIRLSERTYDFYRYTNWIIRAIFKHFRVKKEYRNISNILDNCYGT